MTKKAKMDLNNLALNITNLQFDLGEFKKPLHVLETAGPITGGLVEPEDSSNSPGIFSEVMNCPLPLNAV